MSNRPEAGKRMTYQQLCVYIKKKADVSPRILNLLLDHYLGKPVEHVQHMAVPTFIFQKVEPPDAKAESNTIGVSKKTIPIVATIIIFALVSICLLPPFILANRACLFASQQSGILLFQVFA